MAVSSELDSLLRRGVAEIIVAEELSQLLASGKNLRLKQGFDPSRPDIHLGHVVGLRKLAQFQKLGHQVVLIVGDWTAQIGDPSGASVTRPMLTAEEVKANAQTYLEQFFKVVDPELTELHWQSEWYGDPSTGSGHRFGLDKVISLTSKFTVAQILQREDFARRYEAGRPIAITELLYPLLQAYDSVVVRADVEFGGIDQKFNCLLGRELQAMMGQTPQQVLLVPLLVGTDGVQKMSKSLGNYIGITDPPREMYGKVMSIPDSLMLDYYELLTDLPEGELAGMRQQLRPEPVEGRAAQSVNPMVLKQRLAREIIAQFHGAEAAQAAEEHFHKVFQLREVPPEIAEFAVSFSSPGKYGSMQVTGYLPEQRMVGPWTLDLARIIADAGLRPSRSDALRLIRAGAVEEVGGEKVTSPIWPAKDGAVIRVGTRQFLRIVDKDRLPSAPR
ncbi:MAG: tyrosine--tRNA ligase [Chloroflexi bacterium]|nr:tyrosine--tRNA ligase [Chloroflexota bacterium]